MLDKSESGKSVIVRLMSNQWAVLKRCLRWSKIVKDLYDLEERDKCKETNTVNLRLKPPKRFY